MSKVQFLARSGVVGAALLSGAVLCACGGGGSGGAAMMAQAAAAAQQAGAQAAPVIEGQPHSLLVKEGESAMFAVTGAAGGTVLALAYQWQRDGVDIPGATRDHLILSAASLGDDGARYTVVVRNAAGQVESRPALLAVVSGETVYPWR